MNRVQRLPDWLRFRSRQAAVLTALVICLLLAPWVAEAQGNSAPVFTEGASATRSFNETIGDAAVATGSNIGDEVAAMDTDASDTLTYTLEGTDADRFDIISTSGQLRTKVGEKYDHEAKSSYQVTVRVEDGNGESDTITVTVNVTDQDEPPAAAPQLRGFGTVSTTTKIQLYLSYYPSFNPGRPAITSYEMRYRVGDTGDWTYESWNFWCIEDIAQLGYPSFQTRSDLIEDRKQGTKLNYRAQVRAINAEGEGPWSASASLSGGNWPVYMTPNTWPTGAPTIRGTTQVGETLTADTSGIYDADGLTGLANLNYTYLWARIEYICSDRGGVEICRNHYTNMWHVGGSSYTLRPQDEGKTIRVTVTVIDDRCHRQTLRSQPTGTVGPAVQTQQSNTPATGAPTISGTAQVGQTLTAITSGIDDADGLVNASFDYQWQRQDLGNDTVTDILGATGATYEVTSADRDSAVRVSVSFSDDAENIETLSSYWLLVQQPANHLATGAPTISGTVQVGGMLTAHTSSIADADGLTNATYGYQWIASKGSSDVEIANATAPTYTVAAEDAGWTIQVRVTFTDDADNEQTLTSEATEAVEFAVQPQRANTPATGTPTISGTAQVGETLTAITSAIDDADGLVNASFDYQWQRQDLGNDTVTDILGATGATYEVTSADRDSAVRVSVSFSDAAENSETLSSYWLLVQQPANNLPTGVPTISGTVQVGGMLTAHTSSIADADGLTNVSYEYQWIASDSNSDVEIANATAPTYTVAAEDEGWTILVRVTFTDDADHEQSLTSAATALAQPPAPDGPPDTPNRPNATAVFVGGVDLEWNDVFGAESYDVQLGRGGQWIDLPGDGVEVAFYGAGAIISGLDPEASLWFQVRAVNARGVSDWSEMLYTGSTSQFRLGRKARPDNEPAGGAPVIHGTAQVGESLWGEATGLEDGNGLDRVEFQYQWVSGDGNADTDIAGATNSGYTLVSDDVGQTIRVKVAFTDRGGYSETRTSVATGAVAARPNNPATGRPTIGGRAEVGETLTADTSGIADADGLLNATYSYQWVANDGGTDADISGETDASYTLVADDAGNTIKVRVIVTDDAGNETTLTSAATDEVSFAVQQQQASNTPATGKPTIGGTAEVGETLTADTSGITDADGLTKVSYRYQWVANDGGTDTDISGETDASYTLLADDEGNTIKVRVIVTDDAGNETTLTSAATDEVSFAVQQQQASNTPATGVPTIGGTVQVGETLTADTSGIADADGLSNVSYNYQWVANDEGTDADISGETDTGYTLVADDVGQTIQVKVSFKDDADNQETLTSAATEAVAARPNTSATGLPTIGGTARVGETLTADTSGISDADGLSNVSYNYQWVANDEGTDADISGETDTGYTLVADDVGKTIKVKVSFKDDADNQERLTSAATEAVAARPNTSATGLPTIGGTARVGETLTADTTGIADADGLSNVSYNYQWVANDEGTDADISGETDTGYTLVADDVGKTIQVRVSFTDDADNQERLTSAATEAVAARPNTSATGLPTIGGTAREGEVLTADTTGIADADGLSNVSYGYQWIAGGTDLGGATASTYTLTAGERGKTIKVRVSFTDDADNQERLTSAATEAVAARPNTSATGLPTIRGTVRVGEVLTADTTGIGDADGLTNVSYGYQWVVTDGGAYLDISGETGATYTLVAIDRGLYIQVRVSFTDDAGNREKLTSAVTEVVAAAP